MGETKMGDTGDRMDRAGRYVLGLMNDEERERAERDLEIDPAFRNAMVEIAERMHVFDHMPAPGREPEDHWRLIKEKIDAMPQMRAAEQEKTIEELSGQIAEQWKTIEGLRKKLDALTDRFLVLEEQSAPDVPVTKPPHW